MSWWLCAGVVVLFFCYALVLGLCRAAARQHRSMDAAERAARKERES